MPSKAQLLRMAADLEEAQDAFVELKAKRRKCSECGRPIRARNQTKKDKELEAEIREAAEALRQQRKDLREAEGRGDG